MSNLGTDGDAADPAKARLRECQFEQEVEHLPRRTEGQRTEFYLDLPHTTRVDPNYRRSYRNADSVLLDVFDLRMRSR